MRRVLQPLVGAPLAETNQLADGGTFAKLEEADLQDGVGQRFPWGGDAGSIEIIYQKGRADLVALRLAEFDQVEGTHVIEACAGWSRDSLAQRAGVTLPKHSTNVRRGRALSIYRYDLSGHSIIRMRCASVHTECMEINTLFGSQVAREIGKRPMRSATVAREPLH